MNKIRISGKWIKKCCALLLGNPPFCLNQDANGGVCQLVENFFGFMPFQQVVDILASSLTGFTSFIQIQEIIEYVTQSFEPNPLNTTDYESMSKSFNLIIFQPWVNALNHKKCSINQFHIWSQMKRLFSFFSGIHKLIPFNFNRNSKDKPRNISSSDVLKSCDALQLRSDSVKVIWPGYGDNCYGRDPTETCNFTFFCSFSH